MNSIFSFFTGAGFLDLGFENAGFRVDFVNEYNIDFLGGYQHSRMRLGSPEPQFGFHLGSVEEFEGGPMFDRLASMVARARSEGRRVGFVGGPPCPDFSVAGKNAGAEGDNGRLTATYFQIIRSALPDFFVFENVQGLWRTKVHREFYDEQKRLLEEADYVLHDRLVNALWYGVPQDRRRIFLVGVRGGRRDAVFPWEVGFTHPHDVLEYNWPDTDPFVEDGDLAFPQDRGIPRELTVQHWFERNRVDEHPNQHMAFLPRAKARFESVLEGDVSKKCFKRLHRHRYSPTAAYGNNEVHLHPYKPRRLSVAEALAIQSLPAEYELPTAMSLSDCFKTIGNGVPYLAALGLARSVAEHLRSEWGESEGRLEAAE